MVGGVLVEIAGWKKQGNNGTFLSLNIKPKQDQPEGTEAAGPQKKPVTPRLTTTCQGREVEAL